MAAATTIRWPLLAVVLLCIGGAGWLAHARLSIETDITASLPDASGELARAGEVLRRNPNLDRVVVDLALTTGEGADPDRLVDAAAWASKQLERSGLFEQVGSGLSGAAFSGLVGATLDHMPALFSAEQLERQVAPLLTRAAIKQTLERRLAELSQLSGVGQAGAMSQDPLGLSRLALARLAGMMPASGARIYRNQLVSADGRHLLLLATPANAGSDTGQGAKLAALFERLGREINAPGAPGAAGRMALTAVGGFRAALDNETLVRADTRRAIIFATVGIALLLLTCFPRPWLGLLALLPALAGLAAALLVYSLFSPRISGLALGFGGALVSITVDHGVAFLLFLDQQRQTSGRGAARQLWSVGLFATLTTVGAFSMLGLSGFPILRQVGALAGLGVGFSFLFVHTVLPLVFPAMGPARRGPLLPLQPALARLTRGKGPWSLVAAGLVLAALLPFARPTFQVDLAAMNTVQPDTLAAEAEIKQTWGDIFDRVYLFVAAPDLAALRRRADAAADLLAAEVSAGGLAGAVSPSSLLPGDDLARKNRAAWRAFWSGGRAATLRQDLTAEALAAGFTADAFSPFLAVLERAPGSGATPLPAALHGMLGVSQDPRGGWTWFGSAGRGARYDGAGLQQRARQAGVSVLDPRRYTRSLAGHLTDTFKRMLLLVALAVAALMAVLFLDPVLVLISLLPLAFALFATLGALGLMGHPIDIPGLMLVIVIFGMGIDYTLFLVRSHQRFLKHDHRSQGPVRGAVFLAAGSTLVGMLSLTAADHAVPRSAGITATTGVLFAALGAFLLLPPLLRRLYDRPPGSGSVARRYRRLSGYVRLFARFKVKLDPMFRRLDDLLDPAARVLDLGCGYGVPAAWLLERRPELRVIACEPDEDRARVARRVLWDRGEVYELAAPGLPVEVSSIEAVLMLDMAHHLDDRALERTLTSLRGILPPGGQLLMRATIPGQRAEAWERRLERWRMARSGCEPVFRDMAQLTAALERAGFAVELTEPSAPGREETWISARASGEAL